MKLKILLIILISAFNIPIQAQIVFEKKYGGSGDDYGRKVLLTNDGGYLLAGQTGSFGVGGLDFYVIKTDAEGNVLWEKTYGTPNHDHLTSAVKTNDGGFAFFGSTQGFINGLSGLYIVKTDGDGNLEWEKTYGGTEGGGGSCQTSDGGYIILGTEELLPFRRSIFIIKTDFNGDTLWTKIYPSVYDDYPLDGIELSGGGYALTGFRKECGTCENIGFTMKISTNGDSLWLVQTGSSQGSRGNGLIETSDSNIAVTGTTNPGLLYLSKIDFSGSIKWEKNISSQNIGGNGGRELIEIINDGFIICGTAYNDALLLKTNDDGIEMWRRHYGKEPYNDYFMSLQKTNDNGFIVLGTSLDMDSPYDEFYLVKTKNDGTTSIFEINKNKTEASFYPNPVRDKGIIKTITPNQHSIVIYDYSGKTIYSDCIYGNEIEINFEDFPKGIYTLRLLSGSEDAIQNLKILVN